MPSSLEKLALFLNNDEKIVTKRHCVNNNEFNLLTRKGAFSYSYIDNWEKLEENQLSPCSYKRIFTLHKF